MAKSVFHSDRSICSPQIAIRTKICKANAHLAALNLFILNKRFEESYKTSVNLQDLDVYFILQHF